MVERRVVSAAWRRTPTSRWIVQPDARARAARSDPTRRFSTTYALHNWTVNVVIALPFLYLTAFGPIILACVALDVVGWIETGEDRRVSQARLSAAWRGLCRRPFCPPERSRGVS